MGKKHARHVVTVYGRKPNLAAEPEYYSAINIVAQEVSNQTGDPVFFKPRLLEPGNAVADLVSPTRETAEEVAKKLKHLGKYERVEIESSVVDLGNFRPPNYRGN